MRTKVAFSADRNYLRELLVVLKSVVIFDTEPVDVAALVFGLSDDEQLYLQDALREVSKSDESFVIDGGILDLSNFPSDGHKRVPLAAYGRLFLPTYLKDWSRFIYLDCDVLAMRSLRSLMGLDIGLSIIGAVQDRYKPTFSGIKDHRVKGLTGFEPYFNAGVLLIDTNRWLDHGVTKSATEYLDKYRDLVVQMDQEALNAALVSKWERLDPRWNALTRPDDGIATDIDGPWLRHFTTDRKPWTSPYRHTPEGRTYARVAQSLSDIDFYRSWAHSAE